MFNNRVCYRGSAEKWQIHTQWWHFLTAIGNCWFWWCFITKVWLLHHIIIAMFIIECAMGVCRKATNPYALCSGDPFYYCWFWWCFITKVWSVDFVMIIVMFVNGYGIRRYSERKQIMVQCWHFVANDILLLFMIYYHTAFSTAF